MRLIPRIRIFVNTSPVRGMCISVHSKYDAKVITEMFYPEGRFLLFHLLLNGMELVLVNIDSSTKGEKKTR